MREAADLAPDPARAVRAALEYGRTLLHANRPAEAVEVLQGAAAALSGGDPDLAEQIDAELIASSRRLAEYYPVAAECLELISEDRLAGGVGTAQLLAALAVDEAARAGSRERAVDLAHRALAMPEILQEGAIGIYHALNALRRAPPGSNTRARSSSTGLHCGGRTGGAMRGRG